MQEFSKQLDFLSETIIFQHQYSGRCVEKKLGTKSFKLTCFYLSIYSSGLNEFQNFNLFTCYFCQKYFKVEKPEINVFFVVKVFESRLKVNRICKFYNLIINNSLFRINNSEIILIVISLNFFSYISYLNIQVNQMNIIALGFLGVALYLFALLAGVHKVNQGYVGIYKTLGVLKPTLTEPGMHFRIPFYHQFIQMKISIQTDTVENIPCGTSNGTLVHFSKIEVVNKLKKEYVYQTVLNYTQDYEKFWITDKIHSEINQFCSKHSLQEIYIDIFDKLDQELIKNLYRDLQKWAPGIEILAVRVTKPVIPEKIRQNFQQMQKTKIDYYVTAEKQKVKVQQQMTKQRQTLIQAQSKLDVKRIEIQKKLQYKQNDLKMATIEAQIIYDKAKAEIDTQFLALLEESALYPQLLTESYLKFLATDAFTSNATIYLGDRVPTAHVTIPQATSLN